MSIVTALFIYCHHKLKLTKEKRHTLECERFDKMMDASQIQGQDIDDLNQSIETDEF
jgi:hypothetical protein